VRRSLRFALPLAALALAGGAGPAAAQAQAASAEVGGGSTTLTLDPATAGVLTANGVTVAPVDPAAPSGGGIAFPVTGGSADPATLAGSVRHAGGLRITAGGKALVLKNFTYTITAKGASLSASVGGARLRILELSLANASVSKGGLSASASGIEATLSNGAANALNATFGVSLFSGGLAIGTVDTTVTFAEAILEGGQTELAFDPGAVAALTSLGITPSGTGAAVPTAAGLAFPITTGRLAVPSLAGLIGHEGGIQLTSSEGKLVLKDFIVSTDGSPYLSAIVRGQRVRVLNLDLSGLTVAISGQEVTVGGVGAKLTATAAKVLNQEFGTSAFTAGLTLGTATVSSTLR
jgi:hypothetical protein